MKNAGVWVTIGLFLIGVIAGFGKLQANVATNDKEIDKLKDKVEILQTSTTAMNAKQEAIQENVKEIDTKIDKILDAVIKEKRGR